MKVIRETRRLLPVKLTEQEKVDAGMQLARICEDIDAEKSLQADRKAQMTAALLQLESAKTQQRILVRCGAVDRMVDVHIEFYEDDNVIERRMDTGEVLLPRKASDEERQLSLDDRTEAERGDEAQQALFPPGRPEPAESTETDRLLAIPGMGESIKDGLTTPLEECSESMESTKENGGECEDLNCVDYPCPSQDPIFAEAPVVAEAKPKRSRRKKAEAVPVAPIPQAEIPLEEQNLAQKCGVCGRSETAVLESAGHFVAHDLCSACYDKNEKAAKRKLRGGKY